MTRPEPSTEEVDRFVARLIRENDRPNTGPMIGPADMLDIVRAFMGPAAAEHAAKTLRLH
jgi:hypothetical protein